jgi:hypothetical protein
VTEGSFAFTVTVSDTDSRSAEHDFRIDVRAPLAVTPLAPQGAGGGLPSSEVGVPWSAKLVATGGSGRFSWSVAAGALPDGVGLNPDGTATGTPHSSGRFGFTVRVADDEGRTAAFDAIVTVAPTLAIKAGVQLHTARPGRSYRAKITTFGGVEPVKWILLRGTLPRGVRLARKLGVLVGTPRRSPVGTRERTKTYRFTVQATDALGVTSTRKLALAVSSV